LPVGLQKPVRLKPNHAIRWAYWDDCISSVLDNREQVIQANNSGKFKSLNATLSLSDLWDKLSDLLAIFRPFKQAIDTLQGDQYITALEVMPQLAKIRSTLEPCELDSKFLAEAKAKLLLAHRRCVISII